MLGKQIRSNGRVMFYSQNKLCIHDAFQILRKDIIWNRGLSTRIKRNRMTVRIQETGLAD